MSGRNRLPDLRAQETVDLEHDGQGYTLSLGYYDDGRPGEAFVQAHQRGTPIEAAARDSAILISLAMQHGLPLDEIRHGLTRDGRGAPASIIGAVVDAVARAMPERTDGAH